MGKDLFPLNRSLAGRFNRQTLNYIKKILIKIFYIKKQNQILKFWVGKFQEYFVKKAILR